MYEIRAVLGRLYPRSPNMEMGSGGIPTLTPADITAALGMVQENLGREIFCALWWPPASRVTVQKLDLAMEEAQFGQFRELMDAMVVAQIAVMRADGEADGMHGRFGVMNAQAARARGMLEEAQANMWPRPSLDRAKSPYAKLRAAVLEELRSNNICKVCKGIATIRIDHRFIVCPGCAGTGHRSASYRDRAESIGKDRTEYFKGGWRRAYDWAFQRFGTLENRAALEFKERLFGGIETPPKKTLT